MPFADRFSPPLTTIGIPHYEIGVAAAELLLERLQGSEDGPAEVVLPARLIVRGSTAAGAGLTTLGTSGYRCTRLLQTFAGAEEEQECGEFAG